jgi:hypothetical protein
MRSSEHNRTLLLVVGLIAALTLGRWANVGSEQTLTFATLGLLAVVIVLGIRDSRAGHQPPR